jgi:hypothetical protein
VHGLAPQQSSDDRQVFGLQQCDLALACASAARGAITIEAHTLEGATFVGLQHRLVAGRTQEDGFKPARHRELTSQAAQVLHADMVCVAPAGNTAAELAASAQMLPSAEREAGLMRERLT